MVNGIGIDLVNVERFKRLIEQTRGLKEKIFHPNEMNGELNSQAASFAAKEALVKALNDKRLDFKEIEINHESSGKPIFILHGSVDRKLTNLILSLSISHDSGLALAVVIVECK